MFTKSKPSIGLITDQDRTTIWSQLTEITFKNGRSIDPDNSGGLMYLVAAFKEGLQKINTEMEMMQYLTLLANEMPIYLPVYREYAKKASKRR